MKIRTKMLFSVVAILVCLLSFAVIASAETFYASTGDELKAANQSAIDNSEADTIYITADIDGVPFVANSSVTYILQANWTNCYTNGGATNLADGVDIAFYADGAERTMTFKNGFVFQTTGINPTKSTITYGGIGGGRLKVDLSSYTSYFMYSRRSYTINLYEVTFTGLRMNKNDWTFLAGNVINMYDGAKIENCHNASGSLIDAGTLNIYGGEITGCYTVNNMGRLAVVNNLNMFGGAIYGNYQYNTRTDDYTNYLIETSQSANIYGGSIYGNYFTKSGSSGIVGKHGTTSVLGCIASGAIGTNYSVTSIKVEAVDGRYSLASGEVTDVTNGAFRLSPVSYSVMFKNANGSVVNAYMFKEDGTVAKAVDSSTEFTVPSGSWSLIKNSCIEATPVGTAQATYYVAIAHEQSEDDGNCETAVTCKTCTMVYVEALTHNVVEALVYANFCAQGTYSCECTNEGCTVNDVVENMPALFKMLGFSVTEKSETNKVVSMVQGFYVNNEAVCEYERINGVELSFGVVAASANKLGGLDPLTLVDGVVTRVSDTGIISHDMTASTHTAFEIKIVGIDATSNEQLNAKLVYCGYVSDGKIIKYLDNGATYENAQSRSYNEAFELLGNNN